MSKKQNIKKLKQAGRRIALDELRKIKEENTKAFAEIFRKKPKILPKFIWSIGRWFFINSHQEKKFKYNN